VVSRTANFNDFFSRLANRIIEKNLEMDGEKKKVGQKGVFLLEVFWSTEKRAFKQRFLGLINYALSGREEQN
jgi:hypothetical protein